MHRLGNTGTGRGVTGFLLACVLAATAGRAEPPRPPFTRAIDIRSLSIADAQQGLPVRLTGTVTFIGAPGSVFVQDETAGTFFRPASTEPLEAGDVVEITGRTHVGYYLPGIGVSPFRIVGRAPVPPAVDTDYGDLIAGRYHYQRVAIEGVARSQSESAGGGGLLRVALGARIVEVRVEDGGAVERALVDSRVRVEGLAAGVINSRRQLVQPFLRTLDWTAISIRVPAVPEEAVPRVSASELLTFRVAGRDNHRIRIGGVVTAPPAPGLLFVRSEQTAFAIRPVQAFEVEVGDRIEVLGFPQIDRFSASVVDARLVQREPGSPPEPVAMTLAGLLEGLHDHDLVAVTARVTDTYRIEGDVVLTLQDGQQVARARVPAPGVGIAVGSLVRVVGICQVESSVESGYNARPEAVGLRLHSARDMTLLESPPWWTVRRLLVILAVFAGIVLLAGLWIAALRRQVTGQTAALRQRIESEAALRERQRIAREFHDSLEQEMAGLGLRLDAATTRMLDDKGRSLLSACRCLVSRIQAETRNLISDLRSPSEQAGDLVVALQELAQCPPGPAPAAVRLEVVSAPPRLPAGTVHHLRMIAGECLANALKHSGAASIAIRLEARPGQLTLAVTDNGCGLASASDTQGRAGHFGCVGIRERCRTLGAGVGWRSEPGRGVTVTIDLPLTASLPV